MSAEHQLYRVIATTPHGMTVYYCGADRQEARAAYHAARPHDTDSVQTKVEFIHDAGTDDFADDAVARKSPQP